MIALVSSPTAAIGRRISSRQSPSRDIAYFIGAGLVSTNIASMRGKSDSCSARIEKLVSEIKSSDKKSR